MNTNYDLPFNSKSLTSTEGAPTNKRSRDVYEPASLLKQPSQSVSEDYGTKKRKVEQIVEKDTVKKFNFLYDNFTEARGEPKMLEITCTKCQKWVMDYQKDGPGNLLRCYADRIYHPSALRNHRFTNQEFKNSSPLKCKNCETILATPFIYTRTKPKKEVRPAYLLCNDFVRGKKQSRMQLQERLK